MQKNPQSPTVKTPAANFTGDVYLNMLFDGDGASELSCGLVRFTPGARTNWHTHANGQLLVCTGGTGLVGSRDGNAVVLRAGESVWIPADEEHFHGGTSQTMMCHSAIVDGAGPKDATTWLGPVTDEQYTVAHTAAGVQA